jgi:uncharacterized protein (TIGR02246 family)
MAGLPQPRDVMHALGDALNAKDAEALGALFSEDAEFVNIMGMRMRRRHGIVKGHAWAFSGPLAGSRVEFDAIDELPVTSDVVVLHGHVLRERLPDASPNTLPSGATVLQLVTRRGPDGWHAVAAMNVVESLPPAAP